MKKQRAKMVGCLVERRRNTKEEFFVITTTQYSTKQPKCTQKYHTTNSSGQPESNIRPRGNVGQTLTTKPSALHTVYSYTNKRKGTITQKTANIVFFIKITLNITRKS